MTPLHAALGVAVLGLLVMPFAFAGAAAGPEATTSAPSLSKQVKKLKKRIRALEDRGGATGPAGGDLTGTYPNPEIGPNTVGSDEIVDASITGADVADQTLGAQQIADGSVGFLELGNGSVGGLELKSTTVRTGTETDVPTGQSSQASVLCLGDEQVISGGGQWSGALNENKGIQASFLAGNGWAVAGKNQTGGNRNLSAFAVCLAG